MQTLLQGAGIFIWPLALCSLLAVFLVVERALALRVSRVAPEGVLKSVLNGNLDQVGPADGESVAGRLVQRWKDGASGEVLKAWTRNELIRLHRGLHLLDRGGSCTHRSYDDAPTGHRYARSRGGS